MFYQERQKKILEYIEEKPSVSVAELSRVFQVSAVTIRKDLNELSEEGKVERTHGGAISRNKTGYEAVEEEKESLNMDSKREIARKALTLVDEDSTIILDAGSTTQELARLLLEKKIPGVTIVTHALNIAWLFHQSKDYHLVLVGGQYRPGIMSFVGPYAVQMMNSLNADRCFLGTNGYTFEEGITTPNPYEAEMKRTILNRSRERFLVADSRKYGNICMSKVAGVSELDGVITDDELPASVRAQLKENGVLVL